jgi:hypothetical protein
MILTVMLLPKKCIFLEYFLSGTFSVHGFLLHIYTQAIFVILFDTRITGQMNVCLKNFSYSVQILGFVHAVYSGPT